MTVLVPPSALVSVGALGFLSVGMALRMSLYRLAGSPGDGEPNSPLTIFSQYQLLNAEWAPVGAFLAIANVVKGSNKEWTNGLTFAFVAARCLFALLSIMPPLKSKKSLQFCMAFPAMCTTYFSAFGLASLLVV